MAYQGSIRVATEAAAEKKRSQTHCQRGHRFNVKNTRWDKRGWRNCRKCAAIASHHGRARMLAELTADPEHRVHGTPYGYNSGCHCYKCKHAGHLYRIKLKARPAA